MNTFYRGLNSRRRTARFAACIMVFAAAVVAARAQTPPYAEFQYSTLTASGNTITATRVPVVTSTGTSYVNVVVEFDVAANGALTIAPGYPQIVSSPAQLISNFLAGNYVGPSVDPSFYITVAGPGVTSGGATEWSSASESGTTTSVYTFPSTATWYAFGGSMTTHPLAARLKAAGITSQMYGVYCWGITGDQVYAPADGNWNTNTLIGVSQTGSALTVTSFTHAGVDQSQPVDQITYINTKP